MTAKPVKAVFLDLFETLVTEYDPHYRPSPSVAQRLGLPEDDFTREWRRRRAARMRGEIIDYAACLEEICRSLETEPDPALIRQLQLERAAAKGMAFGRTRSDVVELLEDLQNKGFTVGLISNCLGEEVAAWPSSALAHLIDPVIFSYAVGCAKPEPEIYQLACRRAGVVPEEAAFVGDGGSTELTGAAEVGMVALYADWYLSAWPEAVRPQRADAAKFPNLSAPRDLLGYITPWHTTA